MLNALSLFCLMFAILGAKATTTSESIQEILNQTLDKYGDPGFFTGLQFSYLTADSDESIATTAGFTSTDKNATVTPETTFGWGSITKEFFNAVLFSLQGEGKVSLTDTIGDHFPEYFADVPTDSDQVVWPELWKDAKIYQLLNMTSGITDQFHYFGAYIYLGKIKSWNDILPKQWSMEQLVNLAAEFQINELKICEAMKFCFAPGTSYNYSNTGYMLVGMIAEKVSGSTLEELFQQIVLPHTPSDGIASYHGGAPLSADLIDQMAQGYCNIFVPSTPAGTDGTNWPYSLLGPAGGLIGNSAGLNGLIRSLFSGKIVDKTLTDQYFNDYMVNTKTGQPVKDRKTECGLACYGLGIYYSYSSTMGDMYLYAGQPLAYWTMFYYIPCYDLVYSLSKNSASFQIAPLETTLTDVLSELTTTQPDLFKTPKNPEFCPDNTNNVAAAPGFLEVEAGTA